MIPQIHLDIGIGIVIDRQKSILIPIPDTSAKIHQNVTANATIVQKDDDVSMTVGVVDDILTAAVDNQNFDVIKTMIMSIRSWEMFMILH